MRLPRVPLPEAIAVPTNRPGDGPGGAHRFQSAQDAIHDMTVPFGLRVEVFADEAQFPELVNPVQMAWDTKGRLWVAAWRTYPHWKPGEPMDDKLLVLEDVDGDGRADTCKTFAGDLHNPTGFEFWMGGVLVANAPDLLFLEDTDGDDVADRRERLLGGLSSGDTHHSANSFVIGPDGALYFQEGTFHMSQVESVYGPVRCRDGCVWRFEPRTFRVERYIPYNFANPHGHVFDRWGQDFMTDGTMNSNYYALAFSGHVSEPDKHSGYFTFFTQNTRPAAATELLVSAHFSPEFQDDYLIANVIGRQGILRYQVIDDGSGFTAVEKEPLVMSSDPNFRPADIEVGPDGAVYFTDWQNPLIGHMQHHLRDPSRDQSHGRVYRIRDEVRPLLEPDVIAGRPVRELLGLLESESDRVRYRARIELSSHEAGRVVPAVRKWLAALDPGDPGHVHHRLEGLWLQQQFDVLDAPLLVELLGAEDPRVRAAATRVLRGMRHRAKGALALLRERILDADPRVRLEAVVALSFFQEPRAAEIALLALGQPRDRFLDYATSETLRELRPAWRAALVAGEDFASDNTAGLHYVLEKLDTQDLLRVPGSAAVYGELLTRYDLEASDYLAAARGLAYEAGSSQADELLAAIARADRRTQGHVDHLISNLFKALAELDGAGRRGLGERLRGLGKESLRSTTRRLTVVAQLEAGQPVAELWREAQESLGGLIDLLDAATLLDDADLARDLFPRVLELYESGRETPDSRARGRYVRIELPGDSRTLSLAEVEVFVNGTNAALGGTATQSSTGYAGVAERAIDGITDGAWSAGGMTHTNENQANTWWELDLHSELPIESVALWNRSEEGARFAGRLDDFILLLLDSERRVVFQRRVPKAELTRTTVEVPAPALLLRRVTVPALARLSSYDEGHKARAIEALVSRFDESEVRSEIAAALASQDPTEWTRDARADLAARLTALFERPGAIDFGSDDGRRLLALADLLEPHLEAQRGRELRALRSTLGPRVLVIRPLPDTLQYDTREFHVLAGRQVELVFENVDIMPHNLVITVPGSLAEVGKAGEAMAKDADAWERGYIPGSPSVLHHSGLLQPGTRETLSFKAPEVVGDYPYVCTFPGHWIRMNGVMHVVDDPLAQVAPTVAASTAPEGSGRAFVRNWTFEDLAPHIESLAGRSVERGREALEAASCMRCHRVESEGNSTGPPLREVVARYTRPELLQHILRPSEAIAEGYAAEIFVTTNGEIIAGIVLAQTADEVHIRDDPYRDDFLALALEEIEEREPATLSTMPDGLLTTFGRDEILDMLAYLESLRESAGSQ
jgi:putative heme-binding domain-containing protein